MTDTPDSPIQLPLSYRVLLDRYALAIVVVGLLLLSGGVYLAYTTYTAPETVTETVTVTDGTWTVESSFDHGAVVQKETAVYSAGDRLVNLPTYFAEITPLLNGTYVLSQRGDGSTLNGEVQLTMVIRHVMEVDNGEEVTFWREAERLTSETIDSERPSGEVRVPFEVNVSALDNRVSAIETQLGASPGTTEILVVAESTAMTTLAGRTVTDSRESELVVEPGSQTYSVESVPAESETHEVTSTVEREVPNPDKPSVLVLVGGVLLVLVGGIAAGGTGAASYTGLLWVSSADRQRYEFGQTRENLDQWISPGTISPGGDDVLVELGSLEDVVDVAIDSERRVIESRDEEGLSYVVLVDDTRYVFEPPWEAVEVPAVAETDGTQAGRPGDAADATEGETDSETDIPAATGSEAGGAQSEGE